MILRKIAQISGGLHCLANNFGLNGGSDGIVNITTSALASSYNYGTRETSGIDVEESQVLKGQLNPIERKFYDAGYFDQVRFRVQGRGSAKVVSF